MRRLIHTLTLFCAFVLLAAISSAQTNGAIAGVVRDTSGAVLPGVTVEASSPALIEKVRSVVTDGGGNYKILELRPGTYTVTFTLPGFATFRREGVELTTGFTANVNAEMKVGALEETVTVTGASPIVDVQNARTQKVLSAELLNTLPTGKTTNGFLALTLGAVQSSAGALDVGGSRAEDSTQVSIHGSRGDDLKRLLDGANFNILQGNAGGQIVTFTVNSLAVQETVLEGNATAENETTGGLNFVPKDGGNDVRLVGNALYTDDKFQSDNLDDELIARGARSPSKVGRIWDYGVGIGGPIVQDRLWFYSANRTWGAWNIPPNAFWNANQANFVGTPGSGVTLHAPDLSRPAFEDSWNKDFTGRVTFQATPKHKLAYMHSYNRNCLCRRTVSATLTPEAVQQPNNGWNNFSQTSWTYPATNRLLFTAGATFGFYPIKGVYGDGVTPEHISIRELSNGVDYNARSPFGGSYSINHYGNGVTHNHNQRASMAYVTGSHAMKVGMYTQQGSWEHLSFVNRDVSYELRLGVPASVIQYVSPFTYDLRLKNLGLYAQDQWTVQRLTLNYGVRYDQFEGYAPAQTLEATRFTPRFDFPEVRNIPSFKDISPRLSGAYDLFGTGKTALKASWGRYVAGQGTGVAGQPGNAAPAWQISQSTRRTWNDSTFPVGDPRRGNYVPDCDLANQATNGECGPISNRAFGTQVSTARFADEAVTGWGNRPYNWQTSVALQHELRPGVGLLVGYYRTAFKNLTVTDNLTVTPANYSEYCVTTPADARLPGGGGQRLCGLYDLNPAQFGLPPDNLRTKSEAYSGEHVEEFNGVDIAVNARFAGGASLSGGVATGSQATFNCKIIDSPQDGRPGFCESREPWSAGTQVKLNGSYPLPVWDIEASVVYQNLPGRPVAANMVVTNAQIAPSLGRNLSGCPTTGACTATRTVAIVEPVSMFEKRINQLDIRFAKTLRFGKTRIKGMFDIYNLTNDNTILATNNTYGSAWLLPTLFHAPRLFKFGVEVEY